MRPPPVGVLLAAGAGRRLGGCKALLELGGRTALECCLAALREGGLHELRVVLGHQADEVASRIDLSGCEVLINPDPDRGQTSSLRLGLEPGGGPAEACLLHTVDHPLLRAREVRRLLSCWATRDACIEIVVPSVGGRRGHPVILGGTALAEMRALDNDQPAHRIVRAQPGRVQHLPLDAPWLVRDIDRPEDLRDARAEWARRAPG